MIKTKSVIIIASLLIISSFAFSQNTGIIVGQDTTQRVITTAVPFLSITPDSRSGGMGDVGVAISPDANSVHWNPSKLAFIDSKMGFSLSYSPWLAKIINDMSLSYLSGYYKLSREQTIAVSLRYFDLGEIFFTDAGNNPQGEFNPKEFAIDATYARMLSEDFSLGITLRYVNSNLTGSFSSATIEAKPANTVAADVSAYYNKDIKIGNLAFGANISNIGAKVTYSNQDNKDFIPINLRLGSALKMDIDPYNTITFALDFNKLLVPSPPIYAVDDNGVIITDPDGNPIIERGKDPNRNLLSGMFGSFTDAPDGFSEEMAEIMISVGAEYWYNDLFAARAGYFYENQNKGNRQFFTIGVGFRYNVFGFDFAYLVPPQQEHPLAETLRFTLHFNFEDDSSASNSVTD
ncbi:MAG: type IX secretion system outer membrane channel protein PorV [Cyclobacteriaceae bacterium]|nr:type IX secretion system outer membrane channel protein PorV [Cyclobacteriaceae bacterium]